MVIVSVLTPLKNLSHLGTDCHVACTWSSAVPVRKGLTGAHSSLLPAGASPPSSSSSFVVVVVFFVAVSIHVPSSRILRPHPRLHFVLNSDVLYLGNLLSKYLSYV